VDAIGGELTEERKVRNNCDSYEVSMILVPGKKYPGTGVILESEFCTRLATKMMSRMACNNRNHAASRFPFNIFWGCKKFQNLIFWSRILSKELQIIKELLDTLACDIVKLKSKAALSLAISHTKLSEIAPRPMYQLLLS